VNLHRLLFLPAVLLAACSSAPPTIDSLSDTPVAVTPRTDLKVTRAQAIAHYRSFIELAPDSPMYPQALKRLAELEVLNAEDANTSGQKENIEQARMQADSAIQLYATYLTTYPDDPDNDHILYQQAKAHELRGETNKALSTLKILTVNYPDSRYFDEANFRRGEILFSLRHYGEAEQAFYAIETHSSSPYQEKARYKYAWALFKQNRYDEALDAFFILLNAKAHDERLKSMTFPDKISGTDQALQKDAMRAIALAASYQDGTKTLNAYASRHQTQQYEALLYNSLGTLYLSKKRNTDAADTYLDFVERHPDNALAPQFHQQAIEAYQSANLPHHVLPAKADFIKRYDRYSHFWTLQNDSVRKQVSPLINQHIRDLASYYHAASRKQHKKEDYQKAAYWYDYYLKSYPKANDVVAVNFLLAEILYEDKNYSQAIVEFERTAYDYTYNKKSSEAAYAALLIYPRKAKQLNKEQQNAWQEKEINSALRFSNAFPEDKRAISVLAKTAEKLYARGDYPRARNTARRLTQRLTASSQSSLHRTAWIVLGHASFELAEFKQAETAYTQALKYIRTSDKQKSVRTQRKGIQDRLAASIYKQGEAAQKQGQIELAIFHFSRIKTVAPNSKIRLTADYDAASLLIQSNKIADAQPMLESLRRSYPKQSALQAGITAKLAFIYSQTGQSLKAAKELETLALSSSTTSKPKEKREMLWQSSELYTKAGHKKDAARLQKKYIKLYPQPLATSIEARQSLVEYYQEKNNHKAAYYWMNEIIKADSKAGSQRSDRSRYLAASSTLQLTAPSKNAYQKIKLTVPLKKSLKKKKKLMQRSLKAYKQALGYKVTEISTQANYEIAEIYNHFSRALMQSQRPKGLSAEALEQYDILLEEQAFPFEEKAIDIHQANLKSLQQGIYDQWVKKSLLQLQKLQPIRYAKTEKIDSHVSSPY